jgi:hypothetical protein
MREERMRQSSNVEDRRGQSPRGGFPYPGGGGGGRMVAGGGLGMIILLVIIVLMGGNPLAMLGGSGGTGGTINLPMPGGGSGGGMGMPGGGTVAVDPSQDASAQFVARVLGDTEDVWNTIFREQLGEDYQEPVLVLFSGQVESACGFASAASGPFYCPADQKLYIDLNFYEELSRQFGAPGDFAQAYVIAHEVGHHVQNLLGVTGQVHQMRERLSQEDYNQLSVRLELQADFYAGVWAHHSQRERQVLEQGDVEEGLRAASAIGDDMIQRRTQGRVVPESFTHGTSAQRVKWFRKGMETGDITQGDTFKARDL